MPQQGMPPQEEQRRYPRYPVSLAATFSNDRTSGLAMVGNISLGGCRMESHVAIAPDDIGQLLIELPGSHPLKVSHAVVRWVIGNECGVEFVKVNTEDQGWISTITSRPTKL